MKIRFRFWIFWVVIVIWGLTFVLVPFACTEQRGQFGDMFGAANALFAGLAFAALLITIQQQREELEGQNRQFELQRFETTLFQMLSLHNDIVQSIDLNVERLDISTILVRKPDQKPIEDRFVGRECFRVLYEEFKGVNNVRTKEYIRSNEIMKLNQDWLEFFDKHEHDLGHYYRFLFNIFEFIDERAPTNKHFYAKIVRAQLSDYEQAMLVYNCISEYGRDFIKYLEKYELDKHVRPGLLIDEQHRTLVRTVNNRQ